MYFFVKKHRGCKNRPSPKAHCRTSCPFPVAKTIVQSISMKSPSPFFSLLSAFAFHSVLAEWCGQRVARANWDWLVNWYTKVIDCVLTVDQRCRQEVCPSAPTEEIGMLLPTCSNLTQQVSWLLLCISHWIYTNFQPFREAWRTKPHSVLLSTGSWWISIGLLQSDLVLGGFDVVSRSVATSASSLATWIFRACSGETRNVQSWVAFVVSHVIWISCATHTHTHTHTDIYIYTYIYI